MTDTTYDGADLVISNATVAIDGPHAFNSLLLTNKAILTHSPCTMTARHEFDVNVPNDLVVSADSRIDVSGSGYLPGYTTGNTTVGGSIYVRNRQEAFGTLTPRTGSAGRPIPDCHRQHCQAASALGEDYALDQGHYVSGDPSKS